MWATVEANRKLGKIEPVNEIMSKILENFDDMSSKESRERSVRWPVVSSDALENVVDDKITVTANKNGMKLVK